MTRLKIAILIVIGCLTVPVAAQERVLIGTQRLAENGALFLAAAQGYFKAEGIDLGMTAYESDQAVAETLAVGTTDFGLAGFTPAAFNAGGKGLNRRSQRKLAKSAITRAASSSPQISALPKDCVRSL